MHTALAEPIHGVLFDLDQTLIDRDAAFLSWAAAFTVEHLDITDATISRSVIEWLVELDDGGYGARLDMFAAIQAKYPERMTDSAIHAAAFPMSLCDHLPPLDAPTLEVLAALEASRIPWGIVTNGGATQLAKIERVGLTGAQCVLVSAIFGARKPDRAIFHAAAAELGVQPERVLFVGDNIDADIIGAADAGMQTAWICHGREWPKGLSVRPNIVCETFVDLRLHLMNHHDRGCVNDATG